MLSYQSPGRVGVWAWPLTRTATVWFPSELSRPRWEEPTTMADDLRMALQEILRKAELEQDADFLREGVRLLAQQLMELEIAQHLRAERYERTAERWTFNPPASAIGRRRPWGCYIRCYM